MVFCAREFQPAASTYPGVQVLHAPFDDNFNRMLSRNELRTAIMAASRIVPVLRDGEKVLVTCWQGWNRSGLVSALALHLWLGISGAEAAKIIREKRTGALCNPNFIELLERLPANSPLRMDPNSLFPSLATDRSTESE